jgi:hypothetical protein
MALLMELKTLPTRVLLNNSFNLKYYRINKTNTNTMNKSDLLVALWRFSGQNKLSVKDSLNIVEAYRRLVFICNGIGIEKQRLGLGSISTYKSKYFKCINSNPQARISHWWTLTPLGVAMVEELRKTLNSPPINSKEWNDMNTDLFEFRG